MTMKTRALDKIMAKIKFLFRLVGIQLGEESKTTWTSKYRLFYVFNILWLFTDTLGEFLWLIDGVKKGKKITEFTFIAPCTTLCFLSMIKSLFHVQSENLVNRLIYELEELEEEDYDIEKEEIMAEDSKFLVVLVNVMNVFNAFTVIVFSAAPLILMAKKYFNTNELELVLPFLAVYPFDAYNIHYWYFVYFHQFWSACLVVLQMGGVDCLFYIFCTLVRIHLRFLQKDFERIIRSNGGVVTDNEEFHIIFVGLVKRHWKLMKCINLLDNIYQISTSVNFMTSSFMICLSGFNVMTNDDVTSIISYLIFLSMSMLQIFFLCLFSDLLMNSTADVSDAVYKSKWHLADANIREKLFFVLVRAQKPCKLTAFRHIEVSLKAFTTILSTSWSYFTLLRTIYNARKNFS